MASHSRHRNATLRNERHSENGLCGLPSTQNHDKVDCHIGYPALEGDNSYELAQKYMPKGSGGMVVFGVKGGAEAGRTFIEKLQIFSHLANVGDARSLAIHPASTTIHSSRKSNNSMLGLPRLVRHLSTYRRYLRRYRSSISCHLAQEKRIERERALTFVYLILHIR